MRFPKLMVVGAFCALLGAAGTASAKTYTVYSNIPDDTYLKGAAMASFNISPFWTPGSVINSATVSFSFGDDKNEPLISEGIKESQGNYHIQSATFCADGGFWPAGCPNEPSPAEYRTIAIQYDFIHADTYYNELERVLLLTGSSSVNQTNEGQTSYFSDSHADSDTLEVYTWNDISYSIIHYYTTDIYGYKGSFTMTQNLLGGVLDDLAADGLLNSFLFVTTDPALTFDMLYGPSLSKSNIFKPAEGDLYLTTASLTFDITPNPVPEPGTWLLVGGGFVGLAAFRKRFIKN